MTTSDDLVTAIMLNLLVKVVLSLMEEMKLMMTMIIVVEILKMMKIKAVIVVYLQAHLQERNILHMLLKMLIMAHD